MKASLNGYQVDFLSFTLPNAELQTVLGLLSQFQLVGKDKGLYGYLYSFVAPGCTVLYSPGRSDIHVQLSGQGCDVFDVTKLPENARVTRLDIAFDSYDGAYTVNDVWGLLLQRSQGGENRIGGTIRTISAYIGISGEANGTTIYVGSSKSNTRLRIYDKAAEQGISPEVREGFNDWTRYELQLRSDTASAVYQTVIQEGAIIGHEAALAGVFRSFVDSSFFIVSDSQAYSKARRNRDEKLPCVCSLWLSMFGSFRINRPKPLRQPPLLRNLLRYLKGTATTMKTMRMLYPEYDQFYESVVADSELKTKHHGILMELAPLEEVDYLYISDTHSDSAPVLFAGNY